MPPKGFNAFGDWNRSQNGVAKGGKAITYSWLALQPTEDVGSLLLLLGKQVLTALVNQVLDLDYQAHGRNGFGTTPTIDLSQLTLNEVVQLMTCLDTIIRIVICKATH
jgi:hypothetical protein